MAKINHLGGFGGEKIEDKSTLLINEFLEEKKKKELFQNSNNNQNFQEIKVNNQLVKDEINKSSIGIHDILSCEYSENKDLNNQYLISDTKKIKKGKEENHNNLSDDELIKNFDKNIVEIYNNNMIIKILLQSKATFNEFISNTNASFIIDNNLDIYYSLIEYHGLLESKKEQEKLKKMQNKYPLGIIKD